jgi:apolipoprotein N-acyltransferase
MNLTSTAPFLSRETTASRPAGSTFNLLWLLLGGALTASQAYPAAAAVPTWLGLIFLLRFTRSCRPTGWLFFFLTRWAVAWWVVRDVMPMPPLMVAGVTAGETLIGLIPFAGDRWLHSRTTGILATLVFPCWATAVEFTTHLVAPFGTWGALAYTQLENPLLCQITAITGLAGITFLVTWGAAVANGLWQDRLELKPNYAATLSFFAVMVLVTFGASVRLASGSPSHPNTRVAGISAPDLNQFPNEATGAAFYGAGLSAEQIAAVNQYRAPFYDRLFDLTLREARNGAKLVVWSEVAAQVFAADRDAFIERGRTIARRERIYLLMSFLVHGRGVGPEKWRNQAVLINPDGVVALTYDKTNLVPGLEQSCFVAGDGRLQTLDTPEFGRLGVAICFDAAFPAFIAQAGRAHVDLLVTPAHLWPAAAEMDARMAQLRATENGTNLLRVTGNGVSEAVDPVGRVIARQQTTGPEWSVMTTEFPQRRLASLYPWTRDAFGWLTVVGALGAILVLRNRKTDRPIVS